MKKLLALFLAVGMLIGVTACSSGDGGSADTSASADQTTTSGSETTTSGSETSTSTGEVVEITLWTYPIGAWGGTDPRADEMIANFNEKYPNIKVTIQYLDYSTGDEQVSSAIFGGTTPDIIMEGPERLVSNYGAAGLMVDLSDLWTDEVIEDMASDAVVSACQGTDGGYYEYPLCMTTHCMAINYEVFEAADALQYIDLDTRTWTTENFVKALEAVAASGEVATPGIVYCGGQGGDQGTRALVTNLYSGTYTDAAHTEYTVNSAENVKALELIAEQVSAGNLSANASYVASDELQAFAQQTCAMSFCWNASNQAQYASQITFTPYAVAFPTDDGEPELCGGIWGYGIFDNGDEAKIEAAKTFIDFMCNDEEQAALSVQITGFFPVRTSLGNVYEGTDDEERMSAYTDMMSYLGDYYNVIGGWTEQRTAWWNMLQEILVKGDDVQTAADKFVETANAAIKD